jgi:alpha-tubulin suppressor-like RCC1 family protein
MSALIACGRCSEFRDAATSGELVGINDASNDDDGDWFDMRVLTRMEGVAVIDVACGARHTLALTTRGEVFAFGHNWDGQLGVGDTSDRSAPTPLKAFALLRALRGRLVVQVAAGTDHSLAIDNSGALYAWGSGKSGQLGNGVALDSGALDASLHQLTPRPLLALHGIRIVQVASGASHVLALADDGALFAWGCGRNGRLGLGSVRDEAHPRRVADIQQRTLAVACGWSHSLAIVAPVSQSALMSLLRPRSDSRSRLGDRTAVLFAWGRGADGRLGTGTNDDEHKPAMVVDALPANIVAVAGGHHHSAVIDAEGDLYTFGLNNYGQLGLGEKAPRSVATPTRVPHVRRRGVVGVACGGYHTSFWTNDGRMYSFGLNTHGQLGVGRDPVDAAAQRQAAARAATPTQYVAPASVWASLLRGGASIVAEDDDNDQDEAASPAPAPGSAMKSSESMPHLSLRAMVEHANAATTLKRSSRRASLDLGAHHRHGSGALKSAFESDVAIRAAHMVRPFVSKPMRVRTGTLSERRTPGVTRISAGWRTTFAVVEDERVNESKASQALFTSSSGTQVADDESDDGDDDDAPAASSASTEDAAAAPVIPFVAARGPGTPVRVKPVIDKPESANDEGDDEAAFHSALRDLHRDDDGGAGDATDEELTAEDEAALNSQSFVQILSSSDAMQVASRANRPETQPAPDAMPPPSVGDFEHFDTLQKLASAAVAAREVDSPRLAPMMRGRRPASVAGPLAPQAPQLEPQVWRDELTLTTHWLHEILPDWDRRYTLRATRTQWRRGVPPGARGAVWQRAVGNDLQITATQYAELVGEAARARNADAAADEAPHDDDSPAAVPAAPKRRASSSEQAARLIEIDLPRTMPQLGAFKSGAMRAELQEVLEAYAQFNRRTQYAQGMSYVAAMLHLHLRSPFDTFVTLANLLDRDMFQALYSVSVRGIARHVKVFDALFQRMLPKLSRHFLQLSIGTDYYLLDWYMTVFARALPYGSSARIWDCALLEGDQFLFQSAVGLLRLHQDMLLKADFEQCLQILRTLPAAADEEKLMRAIFSVTLPREFDSLIAVMRAEYERKRSSQSSAVHSAGGRQNLLNAVKDNYLSTGASFVTPTRLSMRPVVRDADDNNDDDEVVERLPVARRLDLT